PLSLVSPVTVASTGDDSPRLAGGRTVKSRRRFITDFVIALMPLGATASAQEYKAQQTGQIRRIGVLMGLGRGRPPRTGPLRGVPRGAADARVGGGPQHPHRHPLGDDVRRGADATIREGTC